MLAALVTFICNVPLKRKIFAHLLHLLFPILICGYQKQTAANVSDKLSTYLSDAPHALPHAAGFSSRLSDAPHAVPQAEPAFAFSFHPAMFESAMILTSCDKFVRLLPCYRFILTGDSSLRKYAQ